MTTINQASEESTSPSSADRLRRRLLGHTQRFALPVLLLLLVVGFGFLRPDTFFTVANFRTILSANAVLAILALAAVFPLVVGEFDLSVGANLGLGAILAAGLTARAGLGVGTTVLIAIIVCTVVGLLNGALISYGKIDAFVTTLGVASILAGATIGYTNGQNISQGIPQLLMQIGQGDLWGVPLPVLYMTGVAVIAYYVLEHTPLGRFFYALGGSKEACRLSGINVDRLTVVAFTVSGFLAGIAGVLQTAKLGSGNPVIGPPFLLPAFAAAFLGATTIRPGTFNVGGTIVAVFTIAVGINGLESMGVPFFISPVFTGAALVAAAFAGRALGRWSTA